MKKRAKQLAMLGLAVTMVACTQMTAFASNVEENAPVAVEVQAEETSEEVVAGTEVAEEVKAVEGTEVTEEAEKVADAEETVVLGVSDETETTTEVEAEALPETEAEPAPEAQPTPNTQVTTPDAQVEADEQTSEVKAELTGVTFEGASDGVVTFTDADFDERGFAKLPVVVHGTAGSDFDVSTVQGSSDLGFCNPQDLEGTGAYTGDFYVAKADLEAAGGTKTYNGTFEIHSAFPTTVHDTLNYTITVKYAADENGNGGDNGNGNGGTETPDPDNGNGNGGTETPDPDNGSGDNNGNTETPDGNGDNNTETPDGNNGNNGNTETPDGNNGNDTGNEQKPDDTQKPITGQAVKPTTPNSNTSPKTADMTGVLPLLGTGITSIGVAVAALLKKRRK